MTDALLKMSPVGPVADAWRVSRAFIAGIMGPVGSGKTSTGVAKCLAIAARQRRVPDAQGRFWRRARIAVVRDTYPNLDSTVLATWHSWVPKDAGQWRGDAPRRHRLQIELGPNEYIDLEMVFIAIGDNRVEDALRGLELTAAWLNEADRLHKGVLEFLTGRVGRFPGAKQGGCVDRQIFMDFNAPDTDNWLYELFIDRSFDAALAESLSDVLDGRPLVEFFHQPGAVDGAGAVNPQAENLQNLEKGYYELQYATASGRDYIDRMLRNKFVPMRHGQPVYPEFDLAKHMAPGPIPFDKGRRLVVGLDAGLTPAAVFVQRTSLGDLRVLGELVVFAESEEMLGKVGATRFGQALSAYLNEHYPDLDSDMIVLRCDPAAKDGTDNSGNEQSWLEIVAGEVRRKIKPAPTNALHIRLEAVRRPMMRHEGLLIDPGCKVLRKGMVSGYHYQRVALGDGTGRYDAKPAKNMFSHVQDALQYAALDDGEAVAEILGKTRRCGTRPPNRVSFGSGYFSGGT